jgi:hypothetical protein
MVISAAAQNAGAAFAGRWDLTFTKADASFPSWMEIVEKDGGVQVRAQEREGGVHPMSAASIEGKKLIVTVSAAAPARPAEEGRPARPARPVHIWELTAKSGVLTGVQKRGDAVVAKIRGVRAPELKRATPAEWTEPESLFNGKDLTGWVTMNNTQNPKATVSHWVVKDGNLVNEAQGQNMISKRTFRDFRLHVEFSLDAGANSGIYLRGRYECQMPPPSGSIGHGPMYAIYGMVPATQAVPGKPGEWRTYDITMVGRYVTLAVDGVKIVDNQEIAGITGGALDSNEGEPGPIYFQGDHTGGIKYRNITISVPKR